METKTLLALFHELNAQHFSQSLPVPQLVWNPRLRSSAGRFCPGSRNPLRPRNAEIEVAAYLKELPDGQDHIRDTMLHEMIHYYLWFLKKPHGHTPEFHRLLKKMGARRYNPVPKLSAPKYWYQCPACEKKIPARRKLGRVACAPCCKSKNGGKYGESFRLFLCEPEKALGPEQIIGRLEELKLMIHRLAASKNPQKQKNP